MKAFGSVVLLSFFLAASAEGADGQVKGTFRKDGSYVPPHHRTKPNQTKLDNYSSKPNVNPYSGKAGTVDPYAPKPAKPPKYLR
jgi:hypothetical protein